MFIFSYLIREVQILTTLFIIVLSLFLGELILVLSEVLLSKLFKTTSPKYIVNYLQNQVPYDQIPYETIDISTKLNLTILHLIEAKNEWLFEKSQEFHQKSVILMGIVLNLSFFSILLNQFLLRKEICFSFHQLFNLSLISLKSVFAFIFAKFHHLDIIPIVKIIVFYTRSPINLLGFLIYPKVFKLSLSKEPFLILQYAIFPASNIIFSKIITDIYYFTIKSYLVKYLITIIFPTIYIISLIIPNNILYLKYKIFLLRIGILAAGLTPSIIFHKYYQPTIILTVLLLQFLILIFFERAIEYKTQANLFIYFSCEKARREQRAEGN